MVTIIVLLILAMVSVSLVIRGNIIEKANLAVTEYGKAADQENIHLDEFEGEISKYTNSSNNKNPIKPNVAYIYDSRDYGIDDEEKAGIEVLIYNAEKQKILILKSFSKAEFQNWIANYDGNEEITNITTMDFLYEEDLSTEEKRNKLAEELNVNYEDISAIFEDQASDRGFVKGTESYLIISQIWQEKEQEYSEVTMFTDNNGVIYSKDRAYKIDETIDVSKLGNI